MSNYNYLSKYIIALWIIGIVAVPMRIVPSQVMNRLTSMLSTYAVNDAYKEATPLKKQEITGGNRQEKSISNVSSGSEVNSLSQPVLVTGQAIFAVMALFFISAVIAAILSAAEQGLSGLAVAEGTHSKTMRLFDRILRANSGFFFRQDAVKITNRILSDTPSVVAFRQNLVTTCPLTFLSLGVLLYVIFFGFTMDIPYVGIHRQMGNVGLATLVVFLSMLQSLFFLFDRRIQKMQSSSSKLDDEYTSTSTEIVAGISEIRNCYAFGFAMGRLSDISTNVKTLDRAIALKLRLPFAFLGPMMFAISQFVLIWVGAALCLRPKANFMWSDFMGFYFMAMIVQSQFAILVKLGFDWRMMRVRSIRIQEYEKEPVVFLEAPSSPDIRATSEDIALRNVTVEPKPGVRILDGISLTVRPGEHLGIVGPSGCGKSTMLRLLMRDGECNHGGILVGDKPLDFYNFVSLASEFAFVQQSPHHFNVSIRENLLIGLVPAQRSKHYDKGVNDLLVSTVCRVGLAEDLVKKALDAPCPAQLGGRLRVFSELAEIRRNTRLILDHSVKCCLLTQIVDDEDSSLREVLVGARIQSDSRTSLKNIDAAIIETLSNQKLLDEVIQMGLEWCPGSGAHALSGGQAMKLAIARALLKEPSVLILDEATSAMDERSQARIVALIEREFKGRTVIAISHRLSAIRHFDRIIVLDRGRIVQEGTYDDLVAAEGLFRAMVGQQHGVPQASAAIIDPIARKGFEAPSVANSEVRRILALNPMFANLKNDQIAFIEKSVTTTTYPYGSVLFFRGEPGDEYHIIVDGSVEFFVEKIKDGTSSEEVVDTYGPGQGFGEIALFGPSVRTLSARAKTDLRLLTLQREQMHKVVKENPNIAIALLENVSRQINEMRTGKYTIPNSLEHLDG